MSSTTFQTTDIIPILDISTFPIFSSLHPLSQNPLPSSFHIRVKSSLKMSSATIQTEMIPTLCLFYFPLQSSHHTLIYNWVKLLSEKGWQPPKPTKLYIYIVFYSIFNLYPLPYLRLGTSFSTFKYPGNPFQYRRDEEK